MQNTLVCRNCSTENPLYHLNCSNCSAYLRDKIFNIDLWYIITLLIESPSAAFTRIIQSEHKNFISLILALAAVKFSINTIYASVALTGEGRGFFLLFLIMLGWLIFLITLSGFIYKSALKVKTRFKDNFAILTFSFIPHVFALLILFPVEIILFGGTLFSTNPSPFVIKETLAYVMLAFESLFIFWGILLTYFAFRRQSSIRGTAIIVTILFNLLLYVIVYITAGYFYFI